MLSGQALTHLRIEKELLATVFGCERFNMYTAYGAEIEVLTDPKTLESIFKKPVYKIPPRLQRMRRHLQKYNLKVRYVTRKFLYIADTVSRAFDQSNVVTNNDLTMQMLHKYAREGWSEHKRNVPSSLKSFSDVRNDIDDTDGTLFKDNRLVIPSAWREDIVQKLHISHRRIEKNKASARLTVFWAGMTKHIEEMVSRCQKCMKY